MIGYCSHCWQKMPDLNNLKNGGVFGLLVTEGTAHDQLTYVFGKNFIIVDAMDEILTLWKRENRK